MGWRWVLPIVGLLLLAGSEVCARPAGALAQNTPATAPADQGPVPVPEPSENVLHYHRSGMVLWAVNGAWGWRPRRCFCSPAFPPAARAARSW